MFDVEVQILTKQKCYFVTFFMTGLYIDCSDDIVEYMPSIKNVLSNTHTDTLCVVKVFKALCKFL